MKPIVDFRRCFASSKVCTAIKCCPVEAASYIEVDVPINDKFLNCNCSNPNRAGKVPTCNDNGCDCGSDCGSDCSSNDLYSCGGTPYGRIIIDYDKCTRCGLCVEECCGTAIGLFPEDFVIEPVKGNPKSKCCCEGGCC